MNAAWWALAVLLARPPTGVLVQGWHGFPFRPSAPGRTGSVGVTFEAPADAGADALMVFEESPADGLRWRLMAEVAGDHGTVSGEPGRRAIALFHRKSGGGYLFDGPFSWPRESSRRLAPPVWTRTIHGVVPEGTAGSVVGVVPNTDAICDLGSVGTWYCLGIPSASHAIVAGRLPSGRMFWGEVPPGTSPSIETRSADWCALVQLDGATETGDPTTVSLEKPGPAGGTVLIPDSGFESTVLTGSFLWIAGGGSPDGRVAAFRRGKLIARVELGDIASPSPPRGPVTVLLQEPAVVRGTVTDSDGLPVAGATVLLLEEMRARAGDKRSSRVAAEAETDRVGHYELRNLRVAPYRLRACGGGVGCAERDVDFRAEANDFVLKPRVCFRGRVVSRGGVPQADAWIRISPALSEYAASSDRIRLVPLVARADSGGEFRIAAPANGRFLIEARSEGSGVARKAVEATDVSPAVTDIGDLVMSVPGTFRAFVRGCPAGELRLMGPLGGESGLPSPLDFALDVNGRGMIELPEEGAWLAVATCAGVRRQVEPPLLADVREFFGGDVTFELAPEPR